MKIIKGKDILKAKDGIYKVIFNDGAFPRIGCKNGMIVSFFGTAYHLNLNEKRDLKSVKELELLIEGTGVDNEENDI